MGKKVSLLAKQLHPDGVARWFLLLLLLFTRMDSKIHLFLLSQASATLSNVFFYKQSKEKPLREKRPGRTTGCKPCSSEPGSSLHRASGTIVG